MTGKKVWILSILLCLCTLIYAENHRGVFFKSKEVNIKERTGIDLTIDGTMPYENDFSFTFDIAFRDFSERFGHVIHIKETKDNHQLDLMFSIPHILLVQDKKEIKAKIELTQEQVKNINRWHKVQLSINALEGKLSLRFDSTHIEESINFPKNSQLRTVFGVVKRYGFEIDEVPPISVRDVRFLRNGFLQHFWPLVYSSKNKIYDTVQGRAAEIINPAWVAEQHQTWRKIKTFTFNELPQIAYNEETEELNFVFRKPGIMRFNLSSRRVEPINYEGGVPLYEDAQQVYFNKENQLRSFSNFRPLSLAFDEEARQWNNNFDTIPFLPKYWHHNKLLHPVSGELTTICGYGFFEYSNHAQSLNEKTGQWSEISMWGDTIYPRYLAALGKSDINDFYYLFGGVGNKTGKQVFGKEFYYDLFQVNFVTGHVQRLWQMKERPAFDFTPVNSLVVNSADSCFYTLVFGHEDNATELQLIKGSMNTGEIKFIGNKLPYSFTDIKSFVDLHLSDSHNQLIATVVNYISEGEKYKVDIYAINFPPAHFEMKELDAGKNVWLSVVLPLVFVLLTFCLVLFFVWKNRRSRKQLADGSDESEQEQNVFGDGKSGRIIMFGGFQVFDKNGQDITFRFSPTLKELFLLIAIRTLGDNKGISSKRLQEYLWPDKPDAKAKNNRGVNIKKLRSILEDVGNINVSYDGSYWRLVHGEDVVWDLEYISLNLVRRKDMPSLEDLSTIVSILTKGNFLTDIETEWLDPIKDDIVGKILSALEEVCSTFDWRKHEALLLQVVDVIFTFDPINETALEIKCKLLYKQGKHSLAMEVYQHYTKLYAKLYKEDFSLTFKELLKL